MRATARPARAHTFRCRIVIPAVLAAVAGTLLGWGRGVPAAEADAPGEGAGAPALNPLATVRLLAFNREEGYR